MFKALWSSRTRGTSVEKTSFKNRSRKTKRDKLIAFFSAPLDLNDLELLATWFIPQTIEDQSGLVFRGLAVRKDRDELEYVCLWLANLVSSKQLSSTTTSTLPIDVLAEVHFFIGMICEELSDYSEAAKTYAACLVLQSQNEDLPERVAKTLYRLGNSYGRIEKPEEKKKSWKRAFALMGHHLDEEELVSLCSRRGIQGIEEDTASSDS